MRIGRLPAVLILAFGTVLFPVEVANLLSDSILLDEVGDMLASLMALVAGWTVAANILRSPHPFTGSRGDDTPAAGDSPSYPPHR